MKLEIIFIFLLQIPLVNSKHNITKLWEGIIDRWSYKSSNNYSYVPDFFLIGPKRTNLRKFYNLLLQHNQICNNDNNNINYFDVNYNRGIDWYKKQYSNIYNCKYGSYLIDSYYINNSTVNSIIINNVNKTFDSFDLKRKKIIMLLRNPMDREMDYYKYKVFKCINSIESMLWTSTNNNNSNNINLLNKMCNYSNPYCKEILDCNNYYSKIRDFDDYFTKYRYDHAAVAENNYYDLIMRWLDVIDRRKLFVIDYDSLANHTQVITKKLSYFLRLHGNWGKAQFSLNNYWDLNHVPISCHIKTQLEHTFKEMNSKLYYFINSNHSNHEPDFPDYNNYYYPCT